MASFDLGTATGLSNTDIAESIITASDVSIIDNMRVNLDALDLTSGGYTASISTTNALSTGQLFGVANLAETSDAQRIASPHYAINGGGYLSKFSTTGNSSEMLVSNNVTFTTGSFSTRYIQLSCVCVGLALTLKVMAITGFDTDVLVKVDGKFISLTPLRVTDDGGFHYVNITFDSYAERRIDILGFRLLFGDMYTELTGSVRPAQSTTTPVFMIGDSFTEGAGNEISELLSYPIYAAQYMGWDNLTLSSVGGTGLLAENGKANYLERLQHDIIDLMPNDKTSLVWVSLSINDNSFTVSEMEVALNTLIDNLENSGKRFELVVSSPTLGNGIGYTSQAVIAHNVALRTLTTDRGHTYLDDIQLPLSTIEPMTATLTADRTARALAQVYTDVPLIAGCNYAFNDGTSVFVKETLVSSLRATLDNLPVDQVTGNTMTLIGSTYLTGSGRIGSPVGWGNCDLAVSSDGLHPSDFGHRLKAITDINLLVNSKE